MQHYLKNARSLYDFHMHVCVCVFFKCVCCNNVVVVAFVAINVVVCIIMLNDDDVVDDDGGGGPTTSNNNAVQTIRKTTYPRYAQYEV